MILVDTSVWIDHFRAALPRLVRALHDSDVTSHPFVIGELALGTLRRREETISLLQELPALPIVTHGDVMQFVERHALGGIGWVDAHLLCAAAGSRLGIWTHDRQLRRQADRLALLAE